MKVNSEIFRAYDIRGIVDEALTEDGIFQIGKALGSHILAEGRSSVLTARDGRISGPRLLNQFQKGVMSSGCDVVDIGEVPTPLLYFSTFKTNIPDGVMLTGSHNPKNYNGLKIVINKKSMTSEKIKNIRLMIEEESFMDGAGKLTSLEVKDDYLKELKEKININSKIKVCLDCGNGVAGVVAKEVYERLGCNVTELYGTPDGLFPNHHPDPSKKENMLDLIDIVTKNNSAVGLAFDGDADRLGVISPNGEMIYPDRQMILFSRQVLENNPGATVVFDVKCSKLLSDEIYRLRGNPLICKTGHTFIKQKIRETSACLGGEMSGHIFFNDRWPGFDDGIYAGARMLEIIASSNEKNVFESVPNLVSTPEINIKAADDRKFKIVDQFIKDSEFESNK